MTQIHFMFASCIMIALFPCFDRCSCSATLAYPPCLPLKVTPKSHQNGVVARPWILFLGNVTMKIKSMTTELGVPCSCKCISILQQKLRPCKIVTTICERKYARFSYLQQPTKRITPTNNNFVFHLQD